MFYAEHYTDVKSEEVTVEGAKNVKVRWLVDSSKGAPNFAMRLFDIGPGGNTPLHTHDWEHEIFVVSGAGKMALEGKDYPLKEGSTALVPAGQMHNFTNTGTEVMQMICCVPNQD